MFKEYNVRLKSKQKATSKTMLIRSTAFKSPLTEEVAYVNENGVPFYYVPEAHKNWIIKKDQLQMDFWALSNPDHFISDRHKRSQSQRKRNNFSPSERLFCKYMKRRPSLTFTKRTFDFDKEQPMEQQKIVEMQKIRPQTALSLTPYINKIYNQNKNPNIQLTKSTNIVQQLHTQTTKMSIKQCDSGQPQAKAQIQTQAETSTKIEIQTKKQEIKKYQTPYRTTRKTNTTISSFVNSQEENCDMGAKGSDRKNQLVANQKQHKKFSQFDQGEKDMGMGTKYQNFNGHASRYLNITERKKKRPRAQQL